MWEEAIGRRECREEKMGQMKRRSQNTEGQLGGREPQCDVGSFVEVDLKPGEITGNSMLVQCQSSFLPALCDEIYMLINFIVAIISRCLCISKCHIAHLKYICFHHLYLNKTGIKE